MPDAHEDCDHSDAQTSHLLLTDCTLAQYTWYTCVTGHSDAQRLYSDTHEDCDHSDAPTSSAAQRLYTCTIHALSVKVCAIHIVHVIVQSTKQNY